MTRTDTKPGKAWMIDRIEARREARASGKTFAGYGVCPLCFEIDPFGTSRERRPNGDTRCGHCDGKTPSIDWKQPNE